MSRCIRPEESSQVLAAHPWERISEGKCGFSLQIKHWLRFVRPREVLLRFSYLREMFRRLPERDGKIYRESKINMHYPRCMSGAAGSCRLGSLSLPSAIMVLKARLMIRAVEKRSERFLRRRHSFRCRTMSGWRIVLFDDGADKYIAVCFRPDETPI